MAAEIRRHAIDEGRKRRTAGAWLRAAPALTLALLLGPVLAGLAGTLLPAFGYLPALGGEGLTFGPWRSLLATPGLSDMVRLSLVPGLLATFASLGIVVLFCAGWHGTRLFRSMQHLISPLLSVPHAAAAFGIAFLIAPSGWLVRAVSPWATGWTRPPDVLVVHDTAGLALATGLIAKEIPFLLLMTLAALAQCDAHRTQRVALSLGYGRIAGWLLTVFPRVYPQIRLPVYAVLAYSMSAVDVGLILGPTTPPPLSVQILRWLNDPELALRFQASAAAILQLLLVAGAIAAWRLCEMAVAAVARRAAGTGLRLRHDTALRWLAAALAGLFAISTILALAGLSVWSLSGFWGFPEALPQSWTLDTWSQRLDSLAGPIATTIVIGAAATLLALILSLACLANEETSGRPAGALWLLYLPLITPQIAFLFGVQIVFAGSGFDRSVTPVVLAHLVFVLPYVFLSLSDPFRAWDRRYAVVGHALGAGRARVFWSVRMPMLLQVSLVAAAVGFAVSVGQYLPTLLVGGGRVSTVTTEAVALAAGGDRRVIGVYGLVQMALPFLAFSLAVGIPALVFRNRRAMRAAP